MIEKIDVDPKQIKAGGMQAMLEINSKISWEEFFLLLYHKMEYPKHGLTFENVFLDIRDFITILRLHRLIMENRMARPKDATGKEMQKAIEEDALKELFDEFKDWAQNVCRDKIEKPSINELLSEYEKHHKTDEGIEMLLVSARKLARHSKKYHKVFENQFIKQIADQQIKIL